MINQTNSDYIKKIYSFLLWFVLGEEITSDNILHSMNKLNE